MRMRTQGIAKIVSVLVISFFVIGVFVGFGAAFVVVALISVYAWVGEYTALWRDGVISENNLDVYEQDKLQRVKDFMKKRVETVTGEDISNIKLHIVFLDEANAMAYGFHNVSFTKGAIDACDELTLCSILAHEISHVLSLDAVFNRIIFGDITVIVIGLMIVSFASVSLIWIIFLTLALCGVCRGFISVFITSSLAKGVKAVFEVIQRGVLFIYQAAIGAISRRFEYRADQFAVELGFGKQLAYFLDRFVGQQDNRRKSLNEILYASHPASYLRIQRIKQLSQNK